MTVYNLAQGIRIGDRCFTRCSNVEYFVVVKMILRKIVVKERTFTWSYHFDDHDYQCDSKIVIKDCSRKGKLIIRFRTENFEHGYCPFNEGLSATRADERIIINMNRPKFIAEILTYVLDIRLHDNGFDTTHEYKDGLEILNDLGYTFNYKLDCKWAAK